MTALARRDSAVVTDIVVSAMEAGVEPGVAIAMSGPKGDFAQAYGLSKRGLIRHQPLSLDHRMRIGSITKSFTATAVLMQIDKGKLHLDDKLSMFIKGIPNGDTITVEHMLSMRSGVYDYATWLPMQAVVTAWLTCPFIHTDTIINLIAKHPASFAPGTKYAYTNSNYILLGAILEKITGKPVGQLLTDTIIKPLGLTNTNWLTTTKPPAPYAHGYGKRLLLPQFLKQQTKANPAIYGAAGLLTSTPGDLLKWAEYLKTEDLLRAPTHQERITNWYEPQPYPGEGPSTYSYGLGLVKFGTWIGHDGSVPGYSAVAMYDTQSGATFAGVENLQTPGIAVFSRIFERIAGYLYPGSMD